MDLPLNLPTPSLPLDGKLVVGLVLLALVLLSLHRLRRARRARRRGRVLSADGQPSAPARLLRSPRYGLSGRPDELLRTREGLLVPVEIKSRAAPTTGPFPSHRAQLWVYCLLVEEETGTPPPYGLLLYGDGREFRVPWDREARRTLLAYLSALRSPYTGALDPSPGKCARCPFSPFCEGAHAGPERSGGGQPTSAF